MVLITSENIKLWKLYKKSLNLQLYEKTMILKVFWEVNVDFSMG